MVGYGRPSTYSAKDLSPSRADDSASAFPRGLKIEAHRPLTLTSSAAVTLVPSGTSSNLTVLLVLVSLVSPSVSTPSGGESVSFAKLLWGLPPRAVVLSMLTVPPSLATTLTAVVDLDHFGHASKSMYAA